MAVPWIIDGHGHGSDGHSSQFADFEQVKKISNHFSGFEEVEIKIVVILLNLNNSKESSHFTDVQNSYKRN